MRIDHIKNKIIRAREFIYDLLFPIECFGCGTEGQWLCTKCFRRLKLDKSQSCLNCKKENQDGAYCQNCRPSFYLDGISAAAGYDDEPIKSLIKACKYRFVRDISIVLGEFLYLFARNLLSIQLLSGQKSAGMAEFFQAGPSLNKTPAIIPIPLHNKRLRWRGFNQAEEIGKVLAEAFGLEITTDLKRIKHKKPQSRLNKIKRKESIAGCFAWKGEPLDGRPILIIDDVATTGSTINEAAKILKENGAGKVWALVAAKGG